MALLTAQWDTHTLGAIPIPSTEVIGDQFTGGVNNTATNTIEVVSAASPGGPRTAEVVADGAVFIDRRWDISSFAGGRVHLNFEFQIADPFIQTTDATPIHVHTSTGMGFQIKFNVDHSISFRDGDFVFRHTSVTDTVAGVWYRLEVNALSHPTAGWGEVKLYDDTGVLLETFGSQTPNLNTGSGTLDTLRWGDNSGSGQGDGSRFGVIAASDTDDPPWPYSKAGLDVVDFETPDPVILSKLGIDEVSLEAQGIANLGLDAVEFEVDGIAYAGIDDVELETLGVARLDLDEVNLEAPSNIRVGIDRVSLEVPVRAKLGLDEVSLQVPQDTKMGLDEVSFQALSPGSVIRLDDVQISVPENPHRIGLNDVKLEASDVVQMGLDEVAFEHHPQAKLGIDEVELEAEDLVLDTRLGIDDTFFDVPDLVRLGIDEVGIEVPGKAWLGLDEILLDTRGVGRISLDEVRLRTESVARMALDSVLLEIPVVDPEPGGLSYGTLEGQGLARVSGNDRRIFTIRPKRTTSVLEQYDLRRVVERIKPVDSQVKVDHGLVLHIDQRIRGVASDSVHWEVIPKVATTFPGTQLPYTVTSFDEPVEQPRPPFSGYQGEAWSYTPELAGVSASHRVNTAAQEQVMPTQRVTYNNGEVQDFPPAQSILPSSLVQAGRVVSDAILLTDPMADERQRLDEFQVFTEKSGEVLTRMYSDGIPIRKYNEAIRELAIRDPLQRDPVHRFWVTPARMMNDPTEEILEVRLGRRSLVNYITMDVARYPHRVIVEAYDTAAGRWDEILRWEYLDAHPRHISAGSVALQKVGHPQHPLVNHWETLSRKFPSVTTRRIRVRLRRIAGLSPLLTRDPPRDAAYSLAVRGLDIGYRVKTREDFNFIEGEQIGQSTDVLGSVISYNKRESLPENVLDREGFTTWKSEPQPVNYAVVNFYLDTRTDDNEPTVIDRFYLDPSHAGPHITIYHSNDPENGEGEEFMAERTWTPLPRDYTLQKGYIHIPQTRAKYWKFEFTDLVPEPFEVFTPIERRVKLFHPNIVQKLVLGHVEDQYPKGIETAQDVAQIDRYKDALRTLASQRLEARYRPTEALYISTLDGQERMRGESWVYGFTPWHRANWPTPRFTRVGVHRYQEIDVRHVTKVGFFVGLRTLRAYRANWEANDNPVVYFDTYDDFFRLEPGFTWAFNPGHMTSQHTSLPTRAISRTYHSLNNIRSIQFATEQSQAVQVVPDADFRRPALAHFDPWDNTDDFHAVGDVDLYYRGSEYSIQNIRYVVPPTRTVDRGPKPTIVEEVHHPTWSYRPFDVIDTDKLASLVGGLETGILGLSARGRAYAAIRFTMDTPQTNPLVLEVIDWTGGVEGDLIVSREFMAQSGETIEEFVPFDIIPSENPAVRVRLVQYGKSNDSWRVKSMALFDESIVWEFSVNGGGDWYEAKQIRNNDTGILTFPIEGNQLRYRVTGYRNNLWISAIKIRPHYVGVRNARSTTTHRGPNLSPYDQDVPIQIDPMFKSWQKPVPYYWWAANQRYPLLAVEGAPQITQFSKFFGRPVNDDVSSTFLETLGSMKIFGRLIEENLAIPGVTDTAERDQTSFRTEVETVPAITDEATWIKVIGDPNPLLGDIIRPVFDED